MQKKLLSSKFSPSTSHNPDYEIMQGVVVDTDHDVHYLVSYCKPHKKTAKPSFEVYWGPNYVVNKATHPHSGSRQYVKESDTPNHWKDIRETLKTKLEEHLKHS